MNWRALRAVTAREVRRGRRGMALLTAIGLVSLACALAQWPSAEAAVVVSGFSVVAAVVSIFGPLGDLRADKTLGHLEFDRVLPMSHRALAAARLFGAGVRTSPVILLVVPIFVATHLHHSLGAGTFLALVVFVPITSWLCLTAGMWLLMAINIRWNLRRLWWLPMTIGFSPSILRSILPDSWKAALKGAVTSFFQRNGDRLIAVAGSPAGMVAIALCLVLIPAGALWGTVSLFASGLERYSFDASAAVPLQAKPPRRELAAIGRGPALAVMRYCVRLATEQSWRRLILLGVFVLMLLFGNGELRHYAQFYVRALAALIPGGIALQLSVARARGHLEGIQQLPHPAITVGAGYLLAIAMLAAPGTAVWVLARAVTGTPATVTNVLSLWAWLVAWSWLACVMMVWLTTARTVMIAAVPAIALGSWAAYAGLDRLGEGLNAMALSVGEFRLTAGALLPLGVAGAMVLFGLPLFARGLGEYEFAGGTNDGRWRRLLTRSIRRS